MPRRAGPWYRASRRMWFFTHAGQQHPTGITDPERRDLAEEAYRRLLAEITARLPSLAAAPPPPASRTVGELVLEYLESRRPRWSAEWFRQNDITLRVHLVPAFGGRPANTLTADELLAWSDREEWSSSTRNGRLGAVSTFLAWAGFPVTLDRPPKESRGADAVLTDDEFEAVISHAVRGNYAGDLRELLRVLRETGARPQEVAPLTVADVDWANRCTRLRRHKTRRKTGADRVIHFSAAAAEVLESQRDRYSEGHLFRTRCGNPYSGPAIVKRMAAISKRCGFRAIAYGAGRHSFATKALCGGVPDTVVAAILGHTSTAMVHKNYSHVGDQARVLKDALERVSGRAG